MTLSRGRQVAFINGVKVLFNSCVLFEVWSSGGPSVKHQCQLALSSAGYTEKKVGRGSLSQGSGDHCDRHQEPE